MTFGLKGTGTNSLIVNSREATTNKPQLVINGGGAPPPTPPVGAFTRRRSRDRSADRHIHGSVHERPDGMGWNFDDPGSGSQNTSTLQKPDSHVRSPARTPSR